MNARHAMAVDRAACAAHHANRCIEPRRVGCRPHAHAHCSRIIVLQWQYKHKLLVGPNPRYARARLIGAIGTDGIYPNNEAYGIHSGVAHRNDQLGHC